MGLAGSTDYPRLELVLVDNGSGDDSLELARAVETPFPIAILANPHNESFSDANDQGAEAASGELLLFLNNDTEPFEPGWLRELVACHADNRAGITGSTLIEPAPAAPGGYTVQHRAMLLREDGAGGLRADLCGRGEDPLGAGLGEDAETPVAAGACMLVERDLFEAVGGFTHGYLYGGEDVDLGFKVLDRGRPLVCSGRSLLIHRLGSTRSGPGETGGNATRRGNRRLLRERWGPRLRREYELDRLAGGGRWATPGPPPADAPAREQTLALGFCLKGDEPGGGAAEDPLEALHAALRRRSRRCAVLRGTADEDPAGLDYDVAVHLRGRRRYVPKPGQLNVLWVEGGLNAVSEIERSHYELALGAETPPEALIDATLERAAELRFPTRIGPCSTSS